MDFEIENLGTIEHARLKMKPGVSVLSGRNGCGKTTAIRGVSRAMGGDEEVERRDGTDHAIVRGGGALLRVGKVAKRSGDAELELANTTPLTRLIDPGFADSDAAARARIRALVELLQLRTDDASIETLCGGDGVLLEWLRAEVNAEAVDDLIDAADKLRGHIHALARDEEETADVAQGATVSAGERAASLLDFLEQKPSEETVEDAEAALVEGSRAYERAVAQVEAREDLEGRQERIRATLGPRPNEGAAHDRLVEAVDAERAACAEADRLTELLAQARVVVATKETARAAAFENHGSVKAAATAWDERQAILGQTPEGPKRNELDSLHAEKVDASSVRLARAQATQQYRAAETERQEKEEERQRATLAAAGLRSAAADIPNRLGTILAAAGAKGLTVIGGRLHALREGAPPADFELRLSEGQRAAAALEVAAAAFGDQVVPLAGTYWNSLDPTAKREFAAKAAACGLYVLTETPTDGELRVEHVGAA